MTRIMNGLVGGRDQFWSTQAEIVLFIKDSGGDGTSSKTFAIDRQNVEELAVDVLR